MSGAHAGLPFADYNGRGDTVLGNNGVPPAAYVGTDAFNTIIHELGHALGLKHGHEVDYGNPQLPNSVDDSEFSVMTYWSYKNAGGITAAQDGSSTQTYQMYDIAALQTMYGANFDWEGQQATYTWDPTTGLETLVVGSVTQDQPHHRRQQDRQQDLRDGVDQKGATATYDLSNFTADQIDDMRPGQWMMFSSDQIADLNSAAPAGTPQKLTGNKARLQRPDL